MIITHAYIDYKEYQGTPIFSFPQNVKGYLLQKLLLLFYRKINGSIYLSCVRNPILYTFH